MRHDADAVHCKACGTDPADPRRRRLNRAHRSGAAQGGDRSELALELIADALIALLAELQKPVERPVTSIT